MIFSCTYQLFNLIQSIVLFIYFWNCPDRCQKNGTTTRRWGIFKFIFYMLTFLIIFCAGVFFCQARKKYVLPERDDIEKKPSKVFPGLFPTPEPRLHLNIRHLFFSFFPTGQFWKLSRDGNYWVSHLSLSAHLELLTRRQEEKTGSIFLWHSSNLCCGPMAEGCKRDFRHL